MLHKILQIIVSLLAILFLFMASAIVAILILNFIT